MKINQKIVEAFIKQYADAVRVPDIQRIVSHFHEHFTLSTPKDFWYIKNNKEFISNLEKSFDTYKQLGAEYCDLLDFTRIDMESNHCLVNIKWGLIDVRLNCILSFNISYTLKLMNDTVKIISVIDHDEQERIDEFKC